MCRPHPTMVGATRGPTTHQNHIPSSITPVLRGDQEGEPSTKVMEDNGMACGHEFSHQNYSHRPRRPTIGRAQGPLRVGERSGQNSQGVWTHGFQGGKGVQTEEPKPLTVDSETQTEHFAESSDHTPESTARRGKDRPSALQVEKTTENSAENSAVPQTLHKQEELKELPDSPSLLEGWCQDL